MAIERVGIPYTPVPRADRAAQPGAAAAANRAAESAPPAAEAGEASLFELLTPAEREFFARIETLGPLTYRRGVNRQPDTAAPTGQRVDVRG